MIVVAGESLVDLVVDAAGSITPRAGGSSYNTARAAARLGGRCAFLGRFANDRFGLLLRSGLLEDGVELVCPEPLEAPTTLALAEIGANGNASYHFYLTATAAALVADSDAARALRFRSNGGAGEDSRAFVIGSLGLSMEPIGTSIEGMVRGLLDDDLLVIDPNCRPAAIADEATYRSRLGRLLERADIVKASEEDLAFLIPGAAPVDAARRLLGAGPAAVLLTQGSQPALAITAAGQVEIPVPAVRVADTIGAGDTLCGAFVSWWTQRGLDRTRAADLTVLSRGLALATAAAGVTCQRVGADPPNLADLNDAARDAWAEPV